MNIAAGDEMIEILRHTFIALVHRDNPDLSARQLGMFLICYLESEAQTVRGLAVTLNISRTAVSRGLDRLAEFGLVRRQIDPMDRRSVLVLRTSKGGVLLHHIKSIVDDASQRVGSITM